MNLRNHLIPLFIFASFAACSGDTPTGDNACQSNDECASGEVCASGECFNLCTGNDECDGGQVCGPSGVCGTVAGGVLPEINDVVGNSSEDTGIIVDGMMILGRGLGDITVSFVSIEETIELDIRSQAADSVEVIFPADVVSGDYTLVATNSAGADQQSITLTLPELSGAELVSRINAEDTAQIDTARIAAGFQLRVNGSCPAGESIRAVAADGTVTCQSVNADLSLRDGSIPMADGGVLVDSAITQTIDGFVGVGVTAPTAPFQVTSSGFSYINVDTPTSNTEPRCDCDVDPEAADCNVSGFSTRRFVSDTCYDWWSTVESSGSAAETMYATNDRPDLNIATSGYVGIGTAEPEAKLHVVGDLLVDGDIRTTGGSGARAILEFTTDRTDNPSDNSVPEYIAADIRCSGHWGSYAVDIELITQYYNPGVRRYTYYCGHGGNRDGGGVLTERPAMASGVKANGTAGLAALSLRYIGDSGFNQGGTDGGANDLHDARLIVTQPAYGQSFLRVRAYGAWSSQKAGTPLSETGPSVVWQTWR